MNSLNAQYLLPNAKHIYLNVTKEEIDLVIGEKYVSSYDDRTILGTIQPIEELADKEIVIGGMIFS